MSFIQLPSQSLSWFFKEVPRKVVFCSYSFVWWLQLRQTGTGNELQNLFSSFLERRIWFGHVRIFCLALWSFQLVLRAISCSSCICTRFVNTISLCSAVCQSCFLMPSLNHKDMVLSMVLSPDYEDLHVWWFLWSSIWEMSLSSQRSCSVYT